MGEERRAPANAPIPDLAPPSASPNRLVPSGPGGGMPRAVDPFESADRGGAVAPDLVDTSFGPGPETTHTIDLDDDVVERTAAGARSLPARLIEPARPWPTGVSPDSTAIDLDPSEIALTAEYPAPPATLFAALSYAVSVLRRKKALGAKVRDLHERFLDVERRRDALLIAMLEEHRPSLERAADGRKVLELVHRIETLAQEKRTALSGLSDEFGHRSAELDGEASAVAKQRATSTREVEIAKAILAERKEAHDRAEARKKRLYIEIRGILDTVEKTGGKATAAQNAELAARESEVKAQRPELERAQQELARARSALEARESADQDLARRARDVERRRAALASEAQASLGAQSQGVVEAEEHRAEALLEAARGVLAARGRLVDVHAATLDAVAATDLDVAASARDLERHVRALDAYDHDAVKKGIVVGAVALAVIVLAIVWRLF